VGHLFLLLIIKTYLLEIPTSLRPPLRKAVKTGYKTRLGLALTGFGLYRTVPKSPVGKRA